MIVESHNSLIKNDQVRWVEPSIQRLLLHSKCPVIGLTSGSRHPLDSRALYRLVKSMADLLNSDTTDNDLLLCRLEMYLKSRGTTERTTADQALRSIEKSVLGNWYQLDVPIEYDRLQAPQTLQQLPHMLPKWKLRYRAIVIDLGPMNLAPSRIIGRLCDTNFVMLGPYSCASAQWINQYIDYHEECGAHISGTVIACAA